MALSNTERKALLARIDEEIARLREEVRQGVETSRKTTYALVAGEVHDDADDAVADLLTDVEIAEVKRDLNAIEQLEAARQRLMGSKAGECIDCGVTIDLARLQANPAALRCRECQDQYEHTYAQSAAAQR
ncbi:MAG: TraR/DksA C4-type zinc finger protein [Pseudomonadota bacterium]|nr:MAG: conjugal transfer protein TraR [Pseudomonadota bacterium]